VLRPILIYVYSCQTPVGVVTPVLDYINKMGSLFDQIKVLYDEQLYSNVVTLVSITIMPYLHDYLLKPTFSRETRKMTF